MIWNLWVLRRVTTSFKGKKIFIVKYILSLLTHLFYILFNGLTYWWTSLKCFAVVKLAFKTWPFNSSSLEEISFIISIRVLIFSSWRLWFSFYISISISIISILCWSFEKLNLETAMPWDLDSLSLGELKGSLPNP